MAGEARDGRIDVVPLRAALAEDRLAFGIDVPLRIVDAENVHFTFLARLRKRWRSGCAGRGPARSRGRVLRPPRDLDAGAKGEGVVRAGAGKPVALDDRPPGEGHVEVEEGVPHVGAVVAARGEVVDGPAFAPVAREVVHHHHALAVGEPVVFEEDVREGGEADVQEVVEVVAVDPDRWHVGDVRHVASGPFGRDFAVEDDLRACRVAARRGELRHGGAAENCLSGTMTARELHLLADAVGEVAGVGVMLDLQRGVAPVNRIQGRVVAVDVDGVVEAPAALASRDLDAPLRIDEEHRVGRQRDEAPLVGPDLVAEDADVLALVRDDAHAGAAAHIDIGDLNVAAVGNRHQRAGAGASEEDAERLARGVAALAGVLGVGVAAVAEEDLAAAPVLGGDGIERRGERVLVVKAAGRRKILDVAEAKRVD